MLLCQAVYWKNHSEQVRSDRGITVFTKKFIIVNPSKLVSKTQDQMSEMIKLSFSSVQSLSPIWLFATPWIATLQATLFITNSWSSLKLMSIELVMPSSHLILCRPLLLLPPIPPASESFPMSQLFAWGGQSIGVSASASVLPVKYTGLISFMMDWLDLLEVQGTLKIHVDVWQNQYNIVE